MKDENKIYTKPQYKCAICGKIYDDVQSRMNCEMSCIKRQKEEEERLKREEEERKRKEEEERLRKEEEERKRKEEEERKRKQEEKS